ncbi:MAG: amidohydrolase, partial [Oscillospiraceae bacterium]|nr:amidohydrolase [Oscillospiraceae bacterium]
MKIIDAHMHLPVNYPDLSAKKAGLLREMEKNGVGGAVVISDSELTSDIGSMQECMDLLSDAANIWVVGGISPLIGFREQLAALESGLSGGRLVGIKIYCGHAPIFLDSGELAPVFALAEKYG